MGTPHGCAMAGSFRVGIADLQTKKGVLPMEHLSVPWVKLRLRGKLAEAESSHREALTRKQWLSTIWFDFALRPAPQDY